MGDDNPNGCYTPCNELNNAQFTLCIEPTFFLESDSLGLKIDVLPNFLPNFTEFSHCIRTCFQENLQKFETNSGKYQLSLEDKTFNLSHVYTLEQTHGKTSELSRGETLYFYPSINHTNTTNDQDSQNRLNYIRAPFQTQGNNIPPKAIDFAVLLLHQNVGFFENAYFTPLSKALMSRMWLKKKARVQSIKQHDEKNQTFIITLNNEIECCKALPSKRVAVQEYDSDNPCKGQFSLELFVNYGNYTVSFGNASLTIENAENALNPKEKKNANTDIKLITAPMKNIKDIIAEMYKQNSEQNVKLTTKLIAATEKLITVLHTCYTPKQEQPLNVFLQTAEEIIGLRQSAENDKLKEALNKILLELAKSPYFSEQLAANATDKFALYFANLCAEKYLASNNEEEKQSYINTIFELKKHQQKVINDNEKISKVIDSYHQKRVWPIVKKIHPKASKVTDNQKWKQRCALLSKVTDILTAAIIKTATWAFLGCAVGGTCGALIGLAASPILVLPFAIAGAITGGAIAATSANTGKNNPVSLFFWSKGESTNNINNKNEQSAATYKPALVAS